MVVVVADSTGCNGSASRLTRRTRLDLSTYRKHRERGGQETPTFSFLVCFFLFRFFLFRFSVRFFSAFSFLFLLFKFSFLFLRSLSLAWLVRSNGFVSAIAVGARGDRGERGRARPASDESLPTETTSRVPSALSRRSSADPGPLPFHPEPPRPPAVVLWLALALF